ncbi:MAG: hypothetical protein QOJ65_2321 [Fimbriimonadaceae bacterium]|nr:hypothetical protein [Fimbriimonadaceae bacterium]
MPPAVSEQLTVRDLEDPGSQGSFSPEGSDIGPDSQQGLAGQVLGVFFGPAGVPEVAQDRPVEALDKKSQSLCAAGSNAGRQLLVSHALMVRDNARWFKVSSLPAQGGGRSQLRNSQSS